MAPGDRAHEQEHEHGRELGAPDRQDGACAELRVGPLLIERHVKDCGRTLILYRRVER